MMTLRERRERGNMVEAFKTLKGFNKVDPSKLFTPLREDARPTRANAYIGEGGETRREMMLEVERAKLEVRKNFFTVRAAKAWNDLPEATKTQTTVNGFKNSYDAWRKKPRKSVSEATAPRNDNTGNEEENT